MERDPDSLCTVLVQGYEVCCWRDGPRFCSRVVVLPTPESFPKIFVPQYYESLDIWVGREKLMDDYCFQMAL